MNLLVVTLLDLVVPTLIKFDYRQFYQCQVGYIGVDIWSKLLFQDRNQNYVVLLRTWKDPTKYDISTLKRSSN